MMIIMKYKEQKKLMILKFENERLQAKLHKLNNDLNEEIKLNTQLFKRMKMLEFENQDLKEKLKYEN